MILKTTSNLLVFYNFHASSDHTFIENSNFKTMRKVIFTALLLVSCIALFSFKPTHNKAEIKVTVTAENVTSFDMFRNNETIKGLKTPYEFTLQSADEKFIFKSKKAKSDLKVIVNNKESVMTGTWPVVVLLVDDQQLTTFGID